MHITQTAFSGNVFALRFSCSAIFFIGEFFWRRFGRLSKFFDVLFPVYIAPKVARNARRCLSVNRATSCLGNIPGDGGVTQ